MRAVGIKILKNRLSEYIRLAGGGETILVTDRDRVAAEIGPPRAARAESISDAVVAEGVRRGWITPRRVPPGPLPEALLPARTKRLADVLAELASDRRDRDAEREGESR